MHALISDINIFVQLVTAKVDPLVKVDNGCIDVHHEYIISVEETEKALMAIKCQTSSGPDGLPNWVLCNFGTI